MVGEHHQQWSAVRALQSAELRPDRIWLTYMSMGGLCDQFDLDGYLHGLLELPIRDRDLVAQALNETIEDFGVSTDKAPYSTDSVADEPVMTGDLMSLLSVIIAAGLMLSCCDLLNSLW
ncbi:hypothetical protein [Arthrobacter sp. TMS1-12-1]